MTRQSPSIRQRFERTIAGYRLTYGPKDPAVEKMRFPNMVPLYLSMIGWDHLPPTQAAFAATVERTLGEARSEAVRARAGRAYISLVVQHHAALVLREHYDIVLWDADLDMRQGVDLLVIHPRGLAVGLALMGPTVRTEQYADHKAQRYERLPFVVQRIAVSRGGYTVGAFWLYEPPVLVDAVESAATICLGRMADEIEQSAAAIARTAKRRQKASRSDIEDGIRAATTALRTGLPIRSRSTHAGAQLRDRVHRAG